MNIIIAALGALIVGVLITLVICYFLPKEKIRTTNQALEKEEQEAQLRIKDLEKSYAEKERDLEKSYSEKDKELDIKFTEKLNILQTQNNELWSKQQDLITQIHNERDNWEKEKNSKNLEFVQQMKQLEVEVRGLEERRASIIQTLEKEAKESGQIFKDQQLQLAEEQIEAAKKEMDAEYAAAADSAKDEYLTILADLLANVENKYIVSKAELEAALARLEEAKAKADAAVEVNKRAEMERQEKDFYRLQLSAEDIEEIRRLREVEPYLRDKEPLNKVIYKCYYEKPYTDLIGRIFGARKPSGIYKITHLESGKCYVGQAVNLPERFRQHIKRGVGAEPVTQNKLYPAMKSLGVENFMFEVIEECSAAQLTPREKYWTDFYQAQTYGFTVKKG